MCVCVCVCVCVFKVVIFWETTKEKALKDAEKFALFCSSLCRYVNTFCFTGAKVENKIGMGKQTEEISRRRNIQYRILSIECSVHTVGVHASPLCRGQIVDAPPTHLQQHETRQ